MLDGLSVVVVEDMMQLLFSCAEVVQCWAAMYFSR